MKSFLRSSRWLPAVILSAAWLATVSAVSPPDRRAKAKAGVGDWPVLGGTSQRNMVNLGAKNIPTRWKAEKPTKNIKWMAQLGDKAYAGPVIAGGQVYVGTNNRALRDPKVKGPRGVLMCFREADGKFLWQLTHPMPDPGIVREALTDGLCSTPVVDGDRLYYVTPACEVVCAGTDGKVVWSYDMMKKLKVVPCYLGTCSPLVAGDLLFVVTGNGTDGQYNLVSPEAPSFVAFSKKNGKLIWQNNAPGKRILEGQFSNPAYAVVKGKPQVVFPGGDGWLYAFAPIPKKSEWPLLWKFDCNPKDAVWKGHKGTRNLLIATPVIHDNKIYIGTGLYPDHPRGNSSEGHFWCVDMTKTGDVSEQVEVGGKAKPNPNSGLVWHFGGAIKPRPQTGREIILGQTMSTCAVKDGLCYIAEYPGYLHCLDANTGKPYWEHDLKSGVWGSPSWLDGKVYLGDEDGDVLIFVAGKQKKLLEPVEMGESVLSTPVAANGVLYVQTKSKLFAIK
jgi:outer membrane protein assembly factor BamB